MLTSRISPTSDRIMDHSTHILRLQLDGQWYAEDLAACMNSVATLYDLRIVLQAFRDGAAKPDRRRPSKDRRRASGSLTVVDRRAGGDRRRRDSAATPGSAPYLSPSLLADQDQLSRLSRLLNPQARLEVRRIRYGSPGTCELAGLGTVIAPLEKFLVHVIERRSSEGRREPPDERADVTTRLMRSENATQFVDVAGELGYGAEEWRDIVSLVETRQDAIIDLVDKRKLVGAGIVTAS